VASTRTSKASGGLLALGNYSLKILRSNPFLGSAEARPLLEAWG